MIILLLVICTYLFYINAEYKQMNRKLILENDSLYSVNQQLGASVTSSNEGEESVAGRKQKGKNEGDLR